MTRLLCTLLLAAPAFAGPHVRWVDRKGDVQVTDLESVVEESTRQVVGQTADGRELRLDLPRVLRLVRENDAVPEERDLLRAREDVDAGVRLDDARKVLDRLVRDSSSAWVREYAAAYRAVLAERAGDNDALARIDAFLEKHPVSRFYGMVRRARARIEMGSQTEPPEVLRPVEIAYIDLTRARAPLAMRFGVFLDAARRLTMVAPAEFTKFFAITVGLLVAARQEDGADVADHLLAESTILGMEVVHYAEAAKATIKRGHKPKAALVELTRLRDGSELFLPELRSDAHRELGIVMLANGDRAGAKAELKKARELAPDPGRREAAERALRGVGE